MNVNLFSCHDDFVDQASGDGLPFYKRELFEILTQQLAKGCSMINHLLPMNALLPPFPAQRAMPSMVIRPVITRRASAIRLSWRRVGAVTWGWRHWKSAIVSIMGFCVGCCELRLW